LYETYSNNEGETGQNKYDVPYLMYTLADNGVSVGYFEFSAQKPYSLLKFGYASNLVQDFISDKDENLIPDPEQEAYVAGMLYDITRLDGKEFSDNGCMSFMDYNLSDTCSMFKDEKGTNIKIEVKNDGNASDAIGDTYYQIKIPTTLYKEITTYKVEFKFYLGGNVTKDLTDEETCKNAGISNIWDDKQQVCYVLSSSEYVNTSLYEGGK